jgi:hypothetical protein
MSMKARLYALVFASVLFGAPTLSLADLDDDAVPQADPSQEESVGGDGMLPDDDFGSEAASTLTDEERGVLLDRKLELLGDALRRLQTPSRAYFYSWATIQLSLIGVQAWVASDSDSAAARTSNIIGASVSGASLSLLVLAPWTGKSGSRKFRKLPARTLEEKQVKLEKGESFLFRQAKGDELGTSLIRHLIGITVGVASGLAVGLIYQDSLREAIRRSFGIIMVSELQIITRPKVAERLGREYGRASSAAISGYALSPWFHQGGYGVALKGQF